MQVKQLETKDIVCRKVRSNSNTVMTTEMNDINGKFLHRFCWDFTAQLSVQTKNTRCFMPQVGVAISCEATAYTAVVPAMHGDGVDSRSTWKPRG